MNDEVKVELETDAKLLSTNPCSGAIKTRSSYFVGLKTVGNIPREISCYVYFLINEENGKNFGTLKLLNYKALAIRSGGLEVSLLLTFSCKEKWVVNTLEEFIQNFTLSNIVEISQLTPAIARTRKRIIIKYHSWTRKWGRWGEGKKSIRQNRFRNRQKHVCSYYKRLNYCDF